MPFCVTAFGLGMLIAAILAIRKIPTLAETALRVDRRADLKERLVSSVQLAGDTSPMVRALHLDARQHLEALDLTRLFAFAPSRFMKLAAVAVLFLGLTAWLMPEIDVMGFRQRQQKRITEKRLARVHSERIRSVADTLKVMKTKDAEDLAKAAAGILRVAEDVKSGKINDKVAFSRLGAVGQVLQKMRSELGRKVGIPSGPIPGTSPDSALESPVETEQRRLEAMAGKLEELRQKLGAGKLSEEDRKRLESELGQLSTESRAADSLLGKELASRMARLRASLQAQDPRTVGEKAQQAENALSDLRSALDQLKMMDEASKGLRQAQASLLGETRTCRICGKPMSECGEGKGMACQPGSGESTVCPTCSMSVSKAGRGAGQGLGMGSPGQGQGGTVGPLPESSVSFKPTTLRGQVAGNEALTAVMQKALPEGDAQSKVEYASGGFVRVKREVERALTKEEIPPGSREFVRRYFGSFGQKSQE